VGAPGYGNAFLKPASPRESPTRPLPSLARRACSRLGHGQEETALATELEARRNLGAALRAGAGELRAALAAELHPRGVLALTARALHYLPQYTDRVYRTQEWFQRKIRATPAAIRTAAASLRMLSGSANTIQQRPPLGSRSPA